MVKYLRGKKTMRSTVTEMFTIGSRDTIISRNSLRVAQILSSTLFVFRRGIFIVCYAQLVCDIVPRCSYVSSETISCCVHETLSWKQISQRIQAHSVCYTKRETNLHFTYFIIAYRKIIKKYYMFRLPKAAIWRALFLKKLLIILLHFYIYLGARNQSKMALGRYNMDAYFRVHPADPAIS